jgi:uncharacterized YigZ family protein
MVRKYAIMKTVKDMYKIKNDVTNTIIIDKSKFITTIFRVETVDQINEILALTRKKYYDATHNCYAYIINDGNNQKCSDDGEPAKTAGSPMLDALKKNDLTDCLAITTRYFGGIKLGAGGLIRAYSSSVSEAIKTAKLVETKSLAIYDVTIDYSTYNRLSDFLAKLMIKDTLFASDITLSIALFSEDIENFLNQIKNLTFGKALVSFKENATIDCDVN